MTTPKDIQKISNHTVRIGRGQFEVLRHLNKTGKIEYSDLIDHLIDVGAYGPYQQQAEQAINKFIKTSVIEENKLTLRLTAAGRKLLEVLELMLSNS